MPSQNLDRRLDLVRPGRPRRDGRLAAPHAVWRPTLDALVDTAIVPFAEGVESALHPCGHAFAVHGEQPAEEREYRHARPEFERSKESLDLAVHMVRPDSAFDHGDAGALHRGHEVLSELAPVVGDQRPWSTERAGGRRRRVC
jgi:hypothetical protein